MFEQKSRVLLILPQDVFDRARVLAGKATTALKLPVSLQIVLRALIEEGLKRDGDRNLLANVDAQAQAVRRGGAEGERRDFQSGIPRRLSGSERQARGKGGDRGERSRDETSRSEWSSAPGKLYDDKR
jgi:hypothetical protein